MTLVRRRKPTPKRIRQPRTPRKRKATAAAGRKGEEVRADERKGAVRTSRTKWEKAAREISG